MTAVDDAVADPGAPDAAPAKEATGPGSRVALAALVAVVLSPLLVALLALVGRPWFPMGDWASLAYRTSQVGTGNTPLVGAYTVKGWAHPGPLLYWLGAPLFRLTGEDARALGWTAALINAASVVALVAVAWRRGRTALTLATLLLVALLMHGIGPDILTDLWNPYVPLLPFLAALALAADAALGRPRSLVWAAVPATFAMQCHLAFVSLTALVVLWLWAWCRWWPRLLPAGDPATAGLPRAPWRPWRRAAGWAVGVSALLSVGPLLDAVVDMHNPARILRSFGDDDAVRLGLGDAVGLVGRFVRPDGPWLGHRLPAQLLEVQGSGPLPVAVALAALALCLWSGRRRLLPDVVALATLALTLVAGSIPAAAQLVRPVEPYVALWLELVGGIVWFTVAWTAWRLLFEPAVSGVPARRTRAAVLAGAAIVAAAAWSWGPAAGNEARFQDVAAVVQPLADRLAAELPPGATVRIERRGEPWHITTSGLIYALIQRGVDVTTSDGERGLKWGHEHRWRAGEPYDVLLTVAVHDAGGWSDAVDECLRNPQAEMIAGYDGLSASDRAWLSDLKLRRFYDADAVSDADKARGERLEAHGMRIGVFEGPRVCAKDAKLQKDRRSSA
jgi:hypothetical protein